MTTPRAGRFLSVVYWSVIPAAFIGPGTVTTCALAGSRFGFDLLWALAFSTIACFVLQEAASRATIASGHTLGAALRMRCRRAGTRAAVVVLVLGAVVLGCAAYQAGNVLGAVEGLRLMMPGLPRSAATIAVGAAGAALLWGGRTARVGPVLAATVACMGAAFVATAALLAPAPGALLRGLFVPVRPPGSAVLLLGLVGTTVVPYNLFLGSGLSRGRGLGDARRGLAVAIVIGGVISMAIVVAGTTLGARFGYEEIAAALSARLGGWAGWMFGLGLFAAGFSSMLTAPLAAAIAAKSLALDDDARWGPSSARFRAVWGGVFAIGVACGLSGATPIPVILLAQAFNGVLLPLVAIFLLVVVNDAATVGRAAVNGPAANLVLGAVVAVTLWIGSSKAIESLVRALF